MQRHSKAFKYTIRTSVRSQEELSLRSKTMEVRSMRIIPKMQRFEAWAAVQDHFEAALRLRDLCNWTLISKLMDHPNLFGPIFTELQLRERKHRDKSAFRPQTILQHLRRSYPNLLPRPASIINTFLGILSFAGEEGYKMLGIDLSTSRAASLWYYPQFFFLYTRKYS